MKQKKKMGDTQKDMTEGTVRLPYVKGVSEKLRRIYNDVGIRAACRCGERIKDAGNRTKSKLGGRKNHVIYEIPCVCGAVYIGQTERAVAKRYQEHGRELRLIRVELEGDGERDEQRAEQRMRSSKLVEHCVRGCGLNPDWEKVRILQILHNQKKIQ
jgi:hypothetical protein